MLFVPTIKLVFDVSVISVKKSQNVKKTESTTDVESVFKITDYKLSHWTQKRKPICHPCKRGFLNWHAYNRHMLKHDQKEEQWKCDQCGKQLELTTGYKNHMLTHEEDKKKHVCTQCNHQFLYSSQLERHMESHSGGGKLTCASWACAGKTFHNKDTLKWHMEEHKKEKKFCQYEGCDKYFYALHYLSDHVRRQHKEPYQCENVLARCTFTTQSRRTLQTHEEYYCTFKAGVSDE